MALGTVLLVDDNPDVRESFDAYLTVHGFDVVQAANGLQALDHLRRGPRPCVILLDLAMPVMDGFEFRRAQRADPALADIPVIIFSGQHDVARAATELCPLQSFRKPVDPDRLVAVALRCCGP